MSEVTLKEYVDRILLEKSKAIDMATNALEARLQLLNELRSDVLSRSEYNRVHDSLVERVRQVELSSVKTAVLVSLATSVLTGVLVGLILHYIK